MESIYLFCGLKTVSREKKLIFTQDSRLRFRGGGLNCVLDINPYFNKLNEKVNRVPFYWLYIKVATASAIIISLIAAMGGKTYSAYSIGP